MEYINNLNINSIYNFDDALSINELLCKFWEKLEETINISNESIDILNWIKEEGLPNEVQTLINQLVEDGTIEQMINVNKIEELRTLINNNNTEINNNITEINNNITDVRKQMDTIATLSTTNNLQETINNSGNRVFIAPITHKITSTLFIKDGVYEGVRGKSIILIDDNFIKGNSLPTSEFAIVNKNFSFNHNEYANYIIFKGITFLLDTKTNVFPITTILGLANVKRVMFEQCDIIVKSAYNNSHSCFDLYASCKNVTFRDCYINLDSRAQAGGNWIRNYSADYSGNSITDNITIDNCIFETRGKDEALAIYGWRNTVKNVSVINCKLRRGEDYLDMSNFMSIFASDIEPWANENACVENIKIINNDIDVKGVNNFIIQVGNNSEKGIIKNIVIDNNNIKVNSNCTGVI